MLGVHAPSTRELCCTPCSVHFRVLAISSNTTMEFVDDTWVHIKFPASSDEMPGAISQQLPVANRDVALRPAAQGVTGDVVGFPESTLL